MTFSDEQLVVKQYHKLIRALIPYQQQNKLLEGINKFSGRLPSRVRAIIKEEVIRLTSLTDAPADNSDFAQFPVKKFKHFGIQMTLDKVGKAILDKETAMYQDRYTVGVFESVTNSEFYQNKIKRQQLEKIAKAFTVQAQTLRDIDFGDSLAICPNFPVSSPDFEKGKNCKVAALSFATLVLETTRTPQTRTDGENAYVFTFPEVNGFCQSGTELGYEWVECNFNKATSKHETTFALSKDNPVKLRERLTQYIQGATTQLPLERELEYERAVQDLERDRILLNSPWVPVLLKSSDEGFIPSVALFTSANSEANPGFVTEKVLPNKTIMKKVIKELIKEGEVYMISGRIQSKTGEVDIAATLRELRAHGLLGQFVSMIMESGDYTVLHLRMKALTSQEITTAFGTHDILNTDYPDLQALTHIMYCRDISAWIGQLSVSDTGAFKPFPKSFINAGERWQVDMIMEQDMERRSEPRYKLNRTGLLKTGLFSNVDILLVDISESGMLVQVQDNDFNASDSVRISVPDLKIKNEKYDVVSYDPRSGCLRLKLSLSANKLRNQIQSLMQNNSAFFNARDITRQQQHIHRFIWELAMRHVPSIAVIATQNRYLLDRIRVLYGSEESIDLKPFAEFQHEASLHGFFADKGAEKPTSKLLEDMLKSGLEEAHIVHCVRKSDRRTIFVEEEEFLYGPLRQQVCKNICEERINAFVTQINSHRCVEESSLTSKRLAQLSKIDKEGFEKLKSAQRGYTHVIYLTNISSFHEALLEAGITPVDDRQAPEQAAAQ